MKSIKTKLLVTLTTLTLSCCLTLSVIAFAFTTFTVGDVFKRDIKALAEQTAYSVELAVNAKMEKLEVIASGDEIANPKHSVESKIKFLKEKLQNNDALSFGYIDDKGNYYGTDGSKELVSDQEYFKNAMAGKSEMSDPIYSEVDGKSVVLVSTPITYDGKVVGVLLQRNDGAFLSEIINSKQFGETGRSFMVNKEGTFVADESQDKVKEQYNGKNDASVELLTEIIAKMVTGEVGTDHYYINGTRQQVGFAPVAGDRWFVCINIENEEVFKALDNMFFQFLIVIIVLCIITTVLVYKISADVANKIIVTSKHIENMASGDLTAEVSDVGLKLKNEIGVMSRALQGMQGSIGGIVRSIKDNSTQLGGKSQELSISSEEIAKLSETITEAISEIAEGTSVQSNELIEINNVLNRFNEKLGVMQEQILAVDTASRKIDSMAGSSNEEMSDLNNSVTKIRETFQTFESSISNLGKSIGEINNITKMITDVANQTNLLALNASIEAARAGEAGKGFAVVAEEIGTLAEQSKQSSAEINLLLTGISKETNTLVQDAGDMGIELNSQVEIINRSIETFSEIIEQISDVIPKIQSVRESGVGIEEDKNIILEKIDELSSVSEEISASSEEISASTEEMNGSINNVAESANVLNHMTEDMISQVELFKVD